MSFQETKTYIYGQRVLTSVSILINVILLGPSNQTFSARNYGWKLEGKPNLVKAIDKLFFFEPRHCEESWRYWKIRRDIRKETGTTNENIWKKQLSLVRQSKVTTTKLWARIRIR
jgi:hypothetical protein